MLRAVISGEGGEVVVVVMLMRRGARVMERWGSGGVAVVNFKGRRAKKTGWRFIVVVGF